MFEIPTASRPPRTTTSADGTTIAYDVSAPDGPDPGPLVVLVDGATASRLMSAGLVAALAAEGCTAVAYDRRGRGDSTDTAPYAVQREVEDLAAVIGAVRPGGRAVVAGFSSGAALVLQAVAGGAPIAAAVPFEPPYRLPDSPPLAPDYADRLAAFNAAGDAAGALEYFQTVAVGMPQEVVDQMKGTPFWEHVVGVAPTILYDAHCLGGNEQPVPTDLVAGIDVPVLALASSGSPAWLQEPAREVAAAAPAGSFELLDGDFHTVPDAVLAPRLAAFAQG